MGLSLGLSNEKQPLYTTILLFSFFFSFHMASYLILTGYFSLIFTVLVFFFFNTIYPQTGLDSVIERKRPGIHSRLRVFNLNENDNKTTSVEILYKLRFHEILCFSSVLSASSLQLYVACSPKVNMILSK